MTGFYEMYKDIENLQQLVADSEADVVFRISRRARANYVLLQQYCYIWTKLV